MQRHQIMKCLQIIKKYVDFSYFKHLSEQITNSATVKQQGNHKMALHLFSTMSQAMQSDLLQSL